MALPPFAKPHLSVPDQIALLKSRGMAVDDDAAAAACLERFGYYRLSGYWYPMRQSVLRAGPGGGRTEVQDNFRPGARLSQAVDLCVFDKRLRLLMLDAIERIEVALRVDVAHLLGARDPWIHLNASELHGNFAAKVAVATGRTRHAEWLGRLSEAEARSKEDFVKHFKGRYGSPLPIWMSIELWDFGTLSVFLEGLKVSDKEQLALRYNLPRWDLLVSWTRALNHVRNICAHHSRLWNRSPADQPKVPKVGEVPMLDHLANDVRAQTRLYAAAAVAQFLLRTVNPHSSWGARLGAHAGTFPATPGVAFGQSGFPANWAALPLWRN